MGKPFWFLILFLLLMGGAQGATEQTDSSLTPGAKEPTKKEDSEKKIKPSVSQELLELIVWEIARAKFAKKPIPPEAEAVLKDPTSMTEEEAKRLLARLRVLNFRGEKPAGDAAREAAMNLMRGMSLSELQGLLRDVREPSLDLPDELHDKLAKKYGEVFSQAPKGKLSASDLWKLLNSDKFQTGDLKKEDWESALGNLRTAGFRQRADRFETDFKRDAWEDVISDLGQQIRRAGNREREINPFVFVPPDPGGAGRRGKPIQWAPPEILTPNPIAELPPRGPFVNPQRFSNSGYRILNPGLAGGSPLLVGPGRSGEGIVLTPPSNTPRGMAHSDLERMLSMKKPGGFSIPILTAFDDNPDQAASCQMTVVDRKVHPDGFCSHVGATARHCVENEENPGARIEDMAIGSFGALGKVKIEKAPGRADLALIYFTARCRSEKEVPVVPLAQSQLPETSPILVDGRRLLVGEAVDSVQGNSLVELDVRDPYNNGVGIYQGDSGGAVVAMGAGGKPELVGVISSKLVDPRFHGIGFFAGKSAIDWARGRVDSGITPSQFARHQTDPGSGLASTSATAHTGF